MENQFKKNIKLWEKLEDNLGVFNEYDFILHYCNDKEVDDILSTDDNEYYQISIENLLIELLLEYREKYFKEKINNKIKGDNCER